MALLARFWPVLGQHRASCGLGCLYLLCFALASAATLQAATQHRAPNIVVIMADDLGYGDLGCYGQTKIGTPHLDQMAREGVRFTQHYSGHNVCAPSRAALMTGLHTGRAYMRDNRRSRTSEGELPMPPDAVTLPRLLRSKGYVTGMFGKWGLGNPSTSGDPLEQGWTTYFGYTDQIRAHNYFPDFLLHDGRRVPLDNDVKYLDAKLWHKGLGSYAVRQNVYSHDLIEREALAFIDAHKATPFFLYLPFTLPHDNGEAPILQNEVPDFGAYADRDDWTINTKGYAEMISRLDRSVGRVLERLKAHGLDRDTIVFFTSDNGPVFDRSQSDRGYTAYFNSSGHLRAGKGHFYEGGIRVPLIARWSDRIPAGVVTDHISAHWDLLATVCELTGVPVPKETTGLSYLPALLAEHQKQRTHAYLYWEGGPMGAIAIRKGDWKAVIPRTRNVDQPSFELYNLAKDPGETSDLADRHPEMQEVFRAIVAEAHRPTDHFPLPWADALATRMTPATKKP